MSGLFLWLGAWSLVLWVIRMLRGDLMLKWWAKMLCLPGLIVDSILRGISCLVTATPIKGLHIFESGKPFLDTGRSAMKYVGGPISVALRLSMLFVLTHWVLGYFPQFADSYFTLPDLSRDDLFSSPSFGAFVNGVIALPRTLELDNLWSILGLYTLLTCLMAFGLDHWEFLSALATWTFLILLRHAGSWLGIKFGWFSKAWFIQWLYGPEFWATFSLIVFMCLVVVVLLVLRTVVSNLAAPAPKESGPQPVGG